MKRRLAGHLGESISVEFNESSAPPHCHYLYHNRFTAGPDHIITAHSHLYWHSEFVRSGTMVTTVGDRTYEPRGGEAILLPPHVPHTFNYRDPDTYVFSVKFEIHDMVLSPVGYTLDARKETEAIYDALDALLTHQTRPRSDKLAAVDHLLASLVHLFVQMEERDEPQRKPTLVDRIKAAVEEREGRNITVSAIAHEFGFSETYVRAQFRGAEGLSLKEYIDRERANVAVQYLSYSDMSIKEIAALMEFPDPQCFSRFCRRLTDRSPREIRRALAGGTNVGPGERPLR